jgi:hypothetical protein
MLLGRLGEPDADGATIRTAATMPTSSNPRVLIATLLAPYRQGLFPWLLISHF